MHEEVRRGVNQIVHLEQPDDESVVGIAAAAAADEDDSPART